MGSGLLWAPQRGLLCRHRDRAGHATTSGTDPRSKRQGRGIYRSVRRGGLQRRSGRDADRYGATPTLRRSTRLARGADGQKGSGNFDRCCHLIRTTDISAFSSREGDSSVPERPIADRCGAQRRRPRGGGQRPDLRQKGHCTRNLTGRVRTFADSYRRQRGRTWVLRTPRGVRCAWLGLRKPGEVQEDGSRVRHRRGLRRLSNGPGFEIIGTTAREGPLSNGRRRRLGASGAPTTRVRRNTAVIAPRRGDRRRERVRGR